MYPPASGQQDTTAIPRPQPAAGAATATHPGPGTGRQAPGTAPVTQRPTLPLTPGRPSTAASAPGPGSLLRSQLWPQQPRWSWGSRSGRSTRTPCSRLRPSSPPSSARATSALRASCRRPTRLRVTRQRRPTRRPRRPPARTGPTSRCPTFPCPTASRAWPQRWDHRGRPVARPGGRQWCDDPGGRRQPARRHRIRRPDPGPRPRSGRLAGTATASDPVSRPESLRRTRHWRWRSGCGPRHG